MCTGLKKCMPSTRSGRPVAAAICALALLGIAALTGGGSRAAGFETGTPDLDEARAYGRSVYDALAPYAQKMTYSNYFSAPQAGDKERMVQASITGVERLKAAKAKFDPNNMFQRRVLL